MLEEDEAQGAVDRLAELLRRSVVITDPDVRLLHSSAHFGDEDRVRVQAMLHRRAASEAIGHVLAQGVTNWTTVGFIPSDDELQMKVRVCVPIRWRGELLALLMVMDADDSVTTSELAAINETARELAPVMAARARDDDSATREKAVWDLVRHDPALLRSTVTELDLASEVEPRGSITAVELGLRGTAENATKSHIDMALRNALSISYRQAPVTTLSAVRSGSAILLLNSTEPLSEDAVRRHANKALGQARSLSGGRFDVAAGIGPSVTGIDRAHESAEQARLAYRAATTVLATPIASWTELGPYGPLLRIPTDQLTESALPVELHRLLDADQGGTLTHTLRAYLDHGCSGPAASDALHIHRTTLYYRLNRITELTHLDPADGRTRLVLHLGLSMLDLLKSTHP